MFGVRLNMMNGGEHSGENGSDVNISIQRVHQSSSITCTTALFHINSDWSEGDRLIVYIL